MDGDKPDRKKFKAYPIGYFHVDIAEVQTTEGRLYLYVGIDRTSKFAFVQLVTKTDRNSASAFLMDLIEAVPYKIHTVLTDNGIQFTFPPRYADWFRNALAVRGIEPCIPSKANRKIPIAHDKILYRQRHKIENMFDRLKDWRLIHTCYDRCVHTFMSAICIAATVIFWI